MKKVLKICLIIVAVALCFGLAACDRGPFEGFNDDNAILKTTSRSLSGSKITNISSKYELKADKFNGVIRIKDITVAKDPTLNMDLKINSGKFKVVLVKDDKVYLVTDKDVTTGSIEIELAAGTYNLRIVGQDANIDFTFTY